MGKALSGELLCPCDRSCLGLDVKLVYYVSFHLNLKVPITTAADDIYKYFIIVFQRK